MTKHLIFTATLLLTAAGGSACGDSDEPALETCSALPASMRSQIDQFVSERMELGKVPGLSLVILQNGEPVCTKGYGLANREENRRMTARTLVSIGSTTKTMTALAFMQQREQGHVEFEAPITQYLPWFRTADGLQDQILMQHLLTHTSGLPTRTVWDGASDEGALERRLRGLANVPLEFAPGTGAAYANDGYGLVGLTVQQVSGVPYEEYMSRFIFQPIGMSHTRFGPPSEDTPERAQGYGRTRGQVHPLAPMWSRTQLPSGSATYSSAEDVARFLKTILARGDAPGGRVASRESVERMWQPLVIPFLGPGWGLTTQFGRRALYLSGGVFNSGSWFQLFPDENLAVATLANMDSATKGEVAQGVAALLLGEEPLPATPLKERAPSTFVPDTSVWQQYVGTFTTAEGPVSISVENGRLMATFFSSEPAMPGELEAYGDNEFVLREQTGQLEGSPVSFQPDTDGSLLLIFDGQPVGKRMPQ